MTPVSLYGDYPDTLFLSTTFALVAITLRQRIKHEYNRAGNIFFACCLLGLASFLYMDLVFYLRGPVRQGTVKSIERENQHARAVVTSIYFQLNENDPDVPLESRIWIKKTLKYFPIFEWTVTDAAYNHFEDIQELRH